MGISRTAFLVHLIAIFFSPFAWGTITITSFGGASRQSLPSTGNPQIFGGHIISSSASVCTGTSVCNSCDGAGPGFQPCNETGIGTNVDLVIQGKVSSTSGTVPTDQPKLVRGADPVTTSAYTPPDSSGNFSLTVKWSSVCSTAGTTGCATSFRQTFQVQVGSSETKDIEIVMSAVDRTAQRYHVACDDDGSGGTSTHGYCNFTAARGDAKIYLDNLYLAGGSLNAWNSDVKWKGLVFYHDPVTVNETTTLNAITNGSASETIEYDNSTSSPSFDQRVMGLTNGTYYCFVMANMDETGNIYSATNPADIAVPSQEVCATPEEVVGLLDDKKCFIATAAYGSPFEKHVRTLRLFRDRFLMTSAAGRAVVEFYYDWSPPLARAVASSETARAIVRTMLWPIVLVVQAVLAWGLSSVLLFGASLVIAGVFVIRRRRTI